MALRHTTPDGSVRYSTKHQLGSGGEGSVYLGRFQVPGGEIVAVKVGHPGSSPAMFREARVLAAVANHPNVIPKHISVQEGKSKRGIIVSKFFAHKDLHGLVIRAVESNQHLSEAHTAYWARGVAMGLAHLHARGVAHMDVKLENVFLEGPQVEDPLASPEQFVPRLGDFGFATQGQMALATRFEGPFVAPEASCKDPSPYDPFQADMWSLGVCIVAMRTGHTVRVNRAGRVVFGPGVAWDSFSADLQTLLRGLLSVDPSTRSTAAVALAHPWMMRGASLSSRAGGGSDGGSGNSGSAEHHHQGCVGDDDDDDDDDDDVDVDGNDDVDVDDDDDDDDDDDVDGGARGWVSDSAGCVRATLSTSSSSQGQAEPPRCASRASNASRVSSSSSAMGRARAAAPNAAGSRPARRASSDGLPPCPRPQQQAVSPTRIPPGPGQDAPLPCGPGGGAGVPALSPCWSVSGTHSPSVGASPSITSNAAFAAMRQDVLASGAAKLRSACLPPPAFGAHPHWGSVGSASHQHQQPMGARDAIRAAESADSDEPEPRPMAVSKTGSIVAINCVDVQPGDERFATGGDDGIVSVWALRAALEPGPEDEIGDGKSPPGRGPKAAEQPERVRHLARVPTADEAAAAGSVLGTVQATQQLGRGSVVSLREPDAVLTGHESFVRGVAWDPSGLLLASQGDGRPSRSRGFRGG
ncbi:hypothetical protein FNF28_03072 [Cafeteria roenbergensis]|uniref:non-specific serine/threonine protein kinase n=1 Tax=Cafeteria roenbergensis TaxID=33653 RepID=A0A5A8DN85_CAFRO|nr:hypothetical protein FNF28_03072 [Cafeteria roenbergensis]